MFLLAINELKCSYDCDICEKWPKYINNGRRLIISKLSEEDKEDRKKAEWLQSVCPEKAILFKKIKRGY